MSHRSLLLSVLLVSVGCGSEASTGEAPQAAPLATGGRAAVRVEVVAVAPSAARLDLSLPGEVAGAEDALLASPMGGFVESVPVEVGDAVKKGAVIAVVDRAPRAAQLAQAEAQLQLAQADQGRANAMGDLATKAQLDALTAQVAIAEANVKLARSQLDRATVRSPVDGVVASVQIDEGEVAQPGVPVARVVQLDPVKISVSVPDRDVVALVAGMEAQVSTPAQPTLRTGTLKTVAPVADLSTRSFLVEVSVPNSDHALLPGMIAEVKVARTVAEAAVVLPQDWIVTRLDGYGVFVIDGDVARWRPVVLGAVVREQVVVSEGLAAGDRIVMTGQHTLADGDAVLIAREGACCTDGRPTFEAR